MKSEIKNAAVEIQQVCNGFIVRPARTHESQGLMTALDDIRVYQTMNELQRFIGENFDHRSQHVEGDMQ